MVWIMAAAGGLIFGAGNVGAHLLRRDSLRNGLWAKYFFAGMFVGTGLGAASGALALLTGPGLLWFLDGAFAVCTLLCLLGCAVAGIFSRNRRWLRNFAATVLGNFYLDENRSFWQEVRIGLLRFTWELPQRRQARPWRPRGGEICQRLLAGLPEAAPSRVFLE